VKFTLAQIDGQFTKQYPKMPTRKQAQMHSEKKAIWHKDKKVNQNRKKDKINYNGRNE